MTKHLTHKTPLKCTKILSFGMLLVACASSGSITSVSGGAGGATVFGTGSLVGVGSTAPSGSGSTGAGGVAASSSIGSEPGPGSSGVSSTGTGIAGEGSAYRIALSRFHSCAITSSGGVKCWGINSAGELGNGSSSNIVGSVVGAVDVIGLASGVAAVAVGNAHSCALTVSGGVKCWGWNAYGQLGDGTTTDRMVPVDVPGLGSGVTAIATRSLHTCAVTALGGVKCWGYNDRGQLGDGSTTEHHLPVDVVGLAPGAVGIGAGDDYTCATSTDGTVQCWGRNERGELGDGTTTDSNTPVDVSGVASGTTAIVAGYMNTCVLHSSGPARCWGWNIDGQLGDGTDTDRHSSVDVTVLGSEINSIGVGFRHTCALTTSGGIKCWGGNDEGELGDGTTMYSYTAVGVSGMAAGVAAIGLGFEHTCALTASGAAYCWGENAFGQLGDGTTTRRTTPVEVLGFH